MVLNGTAAAAFGSHYNNEIINAKKVCQETNFKSSFPESSIAKYLF